MNVKVYINEIYLYHFYIFIHCQIMCPIHKLSNFNMWEFDDIYQLKISSSSTTLKQHKESCRSVKNFILFVFCQKWSLFWESKDHLSKYEYGFWPNSTSGPTDKMAKPAILIRSVKLRLPEDLSHRHIWRLWLNQY